MRADGSSPAAEARKGVEVESSINREIGGGGEEAKRTGTLSTCFAWYSTRTKQHKQHHTRAHTQAQQEQQAPGAGMC
jgi:hypothetical protein